MSLLLDPGTYRAHAIAAELGFTNGGDEQVAISFEILDHPGQRITWYGGFSTEIKGQAKKSPCERTFETLRTCGWEGDDLTDLAGIDSNDVEVVLEINEYEGKESNRIKWVNSLGSGGPALKNVMPPDAKKAFAAKMRGQAIASRQKMGGGTVSQVASKPSNGSNGRTQQPSNRQQPGRRNEPVDPQADDDIPF
jgi:hypothetical protein